MTLTAGPGPDLQHPVTLTVPASTPFAAVARATAASVAVRCDADVDAIDDLRVAVSDAFALLLGLLPPDADTAQRFVDIAFAPTSDSIEVRLAAPTWPDAVVPRDSIAYVVLDGLLDGLDCRREPASGGTDDRMALSGRAPLRSQA
jgi:serine/threonine-protein kinase RsbW